MRASGRRPCTQSTTLITGEVVRCTVRGEHSRSRGDYYGNEHIGRANDGRKMIWWDNNPAVVLTPKGDYHGLAEDARASAPRVYPY